MAASTLASCRFKKHSVYLYCYLFWVLTSILQYSKDGLPYQLLCWMQGYAGVCYPGSKSEPRARKKVLENFYPVEMLVLLAFDAEFLLWNKSDQLIIRILCGRN